MPATCVQVPSLHRRGNKYNRPVSGTIAMANNQIRALSADHPHPIRVYPLIRLLARSLARSLANTPDCTPSVFKQTRTLPFSLTQLILSHLLLRTNERCLRTSPLFPLTPPRSLSSFFFSLFCDRQPFSNWTFRLIDATLI